jgi:hypothetical protein
VIKNALTGPEDELATLPSGIHQSTFNNFLLFARSVKRTAFQVVNVPKTEKPPQLSDGSSGIFKYLLYTWITPYAQRAFYI